MNTKDYETIEALLPHIGNNMYQLMERLFPICRSITGNGVRETLQIISEQIPLQIHEVPSGTKVFDWNIPNEWNVNDAYIISPNGKKIAEFKKSNLHILQYSKPIKEKISFDELKNHIYTLPAQPDVIPYCTTFYNENWGFCMTHNDFLQLEKGGYDIVIDSSLKKGSLTYGEYFLEGKSKQEVVITCYVCHPSMCNDNLSGIVLTTLLGKHLTQIQRKYSFRFLFIPETIGSITWLSLNEGNLKKIQHGIVATCIGDPGKTTYKRSREGNNPVDLVAEKVLKESGEPYQIRDFVPVGSDERQFCSPGFNLPFGSLMRTPYFDFPEYHTSADNLDFVKKENLENSFLKFLSIISELEKNNFQTNNSSKKSKKNIHTNSATFLNLLPKCEPQLGKRGLRAHIGAAKNITEFNLAILWILNQSDGMHSLQDIKKRSDLDYDLLLKVADLLEEKKLLSKVEFEG